MARSGERQPGFVNFLPKIDLFWFFYFVLVRILERIEIQLGIHWVKSGRWSENFSPHVSVFFIPARLCNPQANWRETRRLTLGHPYGLRGFGLRAKAGDTNETHMHNVGDDVLSSDKRISIGMDLF